MGATQWSDHATWGASHVAPTYHILTYTTYLHLHQHTQGRHIMPGLVVNAAEAMKQREALPAGEYHAVFTKSTVKDATGPDKYPMLNCEFTVAEDEGEYAGRNVFRGLSASPKAIPFMVDAAIALGADPDDVTQASVDFEAVFKELWGTECWLVTDIREYTNETTQQTTQQTNVKAILAAPSA